MGFLTQLKKSLIPSQKERIEKEVEDKVDAIKNIISKGGTKAELEEAIENMLKPTEFNEAMGCLMDAAISYFAELHRASNEKNEIELKSMSTAKEIYIRVIKNNMEFFGDQCMANFAAARGLKEAYPDLDNSYVRTFAHINDDYIEDGWKIAAWFMAIRDEAESRYGKGGCSREVFDALRKELSDRETINAYFEDFTEADIAYFKCID